MTYYADENESPRSVTGVRDLAAFLDSNPDVSAPPRHHRFSLPAGGQQRP